MSIIKTKNELISLIGEAEYKKLIRKLSYFDDDEIIEYMFVYFNADDEYKLSDNKKAYNELKAYSPKDYGEYVKGNQSTVKREYDSIFSKFIKESDELELDCYNEMIDDVVSSSNFKEEFKEIKIEVMQEFEDVAGYNTNGDVESYKFLDDESNVENTLDSLDELSDLNDKIGDIHNLNTDVIDFDNRDKAFMWCDGVVLVGDKNETHSQLVQQYLSELDKEDLIPKSMKNNEIYNSRPSQKRLKRLLGTENVAFGHIYKDMAFLQIFENIDQDDTIVKDCFEQINGIKKVYYYDVTINSVKRLAKNIYSEYDEDEDPCDVDSYEELLDYDDNVGDTVKVFFGAKELDFYSRDSAFVYLDGKILVDQINSSEVTHSDIIRQYMTDGQTVGDFQKENNLAFGHILNKMAFIDTWSLEVDINEVANQCKTQLNVLKVYMYSRDSEYVKRLARRNKYITYIRLY